MTFMFPASWQISGYYLDGLFYGLVLLLGAVWLVSTIILFAKKQFSRSIKRILIIPFVLIAVAVIWGIPTFLMPSVISGWPIDSVYSPARDKYYILAFEPALTDAIYRVFTADGSRLNPVWNVKFAGTILDYSEDGSLTSNPRIILSKDEQLLVIERGGHFTDAILIDSSQPLTEFVPWSDEDREIQWQKRTELIRHLLAEHSGGDYQPSKRLADSEITAILDSWCRQTEKNLAKELASQNIDASCHFEDIEHPDSGPLKMMLIVEYGKNSPKQTLVYYLTLAQDGKRLLIIPNRYGFLPSHEQDETAVERAVQKFIEVGTYLNPK